MHDTIHVATKAIDGSLAFSALPAVISIFALVISLIAVWKTHFASFDPVFAVGGLEFRVYPIKNKEKRWFIASALIPFTVVNNGVRPGTVAAMRLVIRYPKLPIPNHYEVFTPAFEINPSDIGSINKNRFRWLAEIATRGFMPFVSLSKTPVTKAIIFETRWDHPVIQPEIEFALEVMFDKASVWDEIDLWTLDLTKSTWAEMTTNGSGYSTSPSKSSSLVQRDVYPKDLHKYTGTTEDLSKIPVSSTASYLDFPEENNTSNAIAARRLTKRQHDARTLDKRKRLKIG